MLSCFANWSKSFVFVFESLLSNMASIAFVLYKNNKFDAFYDDRT